MRCNLSVLEFALLSNYSISKVLLDIEHKRIPASRIADRGSYRIPIRDAQPILEKLGVQFPIDFDALEAAKRGK